ncbi:unnamed protein product [Boreogadus saida]
MAAAAQAWQTSSAPSRPSSQSACRTSGREVADGGWLGRVERSTSARSALRRASHRDSGLVRQTCCRNCSGVSPCRNAWRASRGEDGGTRLIAELDISSVSPQALHLLVVVTSQLLPSLVTEGLLPEPPLQGPDKGLKVSLLSGGQVEQDPYCRPLKRQSKVDYAPGTQAVIQAEAPFALRRIKDDTKYYYLLAALGSPTTVQIKNV